MQMGRDLKPGELEITWAVGGNTEIVKTDGLTYSAVGLVLQVGKSKVIIPLTSVKRFRVAGI